METPSNEMPGNDRTTLTNSNALFLDSIDDEENADKGSERTQYSTEMENKNGEMMYQKAEDYWKTVEPSVDGMLGGFSNLSDIDVRDSKKFLKMLQRKVPRPKKPPNFEHGF